MSSSLSPERSALNFFRKVYLLPAMLLLGGSVWSHNLDMQINYLVFDKTTMQMVQERSAAGQPLMQAGDIVGIIMKATPNAGTKTGAGGYSTFFVPVGSQVVGAEYGVLRDNGEFQSLPMKGQSILRHARNPADPGAPQEVRGYVLGPNILGRSAEIAENNAAGFCRGTLAGLYADTGIFYSTDPATAWQSWVNGGGLDGNPGTTADNVLRNNRGDYVTPTTRWDAQQLLAFGVKSPVKPILDRHGRGSTLWGTGSPVAGPESGYAWGFNKTYWDANPTNPNRMRNSIQVGPWKRLRYPGSEISRDTPGRLGTQLEVVGVDGSEYGVQVTPANPLPPTSSWTDNTSPKALRLSWGGLELYRPEFCRIFVKILKNPGESGAPFDSNGYLQLFGETFGGDAGGEYNNYDHVWRYYKPSTIGLSASPMIDMIASKRIVVPNELFHFDIRITNLGNLPMTNAILENPLPSSLTFVSATPAQSAGPSALRWNLGTIPAQSTRSIRLNVRAKSTGLITNKATIRSNEFPTPKEASDTVTSDFIAIMYGTKTVTPQTADPGQKVTYRIVVTNEGACPNRTPWSVREFLPEGFKFVRVVDQYINGGKTTFGGSSGVVSLTNTDLTQPAFKITKALDVGKTLEIVFEAELSASQEPGKYFNRYAVDYDDKVYATGLIAPVTVGGAKIGDLVYQDWNSNGQHDSGEPGLAGVQLQLWTDPNGDGNPADGVLVRSVTTDSQGGYSFGGTQAGNYVVQVSGGVPAGYVLTGDPEGAVDGRAKLTLTSDTDALWVDFGYKPQGTLSISGLVYSDVVNDGVYQSDKDTPINGATVTLFFDANSNGIVDSADIQIAAATTASGGAYSFSDLASGLHYVAKLTTPSPVLAAFFEPNGYKESSPVELEIQNLTTSVSDKNFGLFADLPGSIGDQVFQDLNGNGIFDAGDIALPRVTVRLYRDENNNKAPDPDELVSEMSTNSLGKYRFLDVGEGDYVVEVDLNDPDIPTGLTLVPPHLPVTVLPSENRLDIDFPLKRVLNLQVSPSGSALPGSRLTYTLNTNYPHVTAMGSILLSNSLPAGTTFVPGSITGGGSFGGGAVTWNLGSTSAPQQHSYTPLITCVRNIRLEETTTVEDTYINANSGTTNYQNATLRFRPSNASQQRHSMIKFNVAEVPPGATIRNVSIGLKVSSTQSSQVVTLYPMNTAWIESVATWNDPNGSAAGRWASGTTFSASDFDSTKPLGSFTPNTTGYKTITSTALKDLVQSWINDPASNKGIGLIVTGTSTSESQVFNSESTPNNVPYLDIEFEYVVADACNVDSRGAAYWSRNGVLNGQWAYWNGGNFESTQTAPAVAASFEFVVGASSAQRDEKIIAGVLNTTSTTNIVGQMWDGTAWTNLPISPLGRATSISDVGVAVGYEQQSGRAVLVWNDTREPAGRKLRYSVWDGTAWTTPASVTSYTGAEPSNMKIVVKPDSNEMLLVINAYDYSDHVIVWNGTSWNNSLQLESGVANNANIHDIAVAYESLSGRGMVFYGKNNSPHVFYRIWNGTSWSGEQQRSSPSNMGVTRYLTAASDPGGNNIAIGVTAAGRDAWFSIWNGSSWSTPYVAEYDLATENAPTVSCAFESLSGKLLVAYSEDKHSGVKYRTWSQSGGWSAEDTTIPLNNVANSVILCPDLNTNQIMMCAQDNSLSVMATRWMGDRWKGFRELEDNTGKSDRQPFNYLWDIYRRNPNPPETSATGLAGPASILNHNQEIDVSVTLTASRNTEGVLPADPSFILVNGSGVTATKLSGPSPGASVVGQRGTTYTWRYRVNGGANPAEALFRWPQLFIADATFPSTDSNSFIYAPTMTFQVDIDTPPLNPLVQNQASINLGGQSVPSNRVETPLVASIGDQVWADYNLDGIPDANEPGLAGVRVFIDQNGNGLFDPGEREAVTDAAGHYLIAGVGAGTHVVLVDVTTTPEDFIASTATAFSRTLTSTQSAFDCDFGFAPRPADAAAASIAGRFWMDHDEDGIERFDEPGIPGVLVKLHADLNGNGQLDTEDYLVTTTLTDGAGGYRFDTLFAGAYIVVPDSSYLPPGLLLVSGHTPLSGRIPATLAAAQAHSGANFGYNHTGSIGGLVFYDHNGNGLFEPAGADGIPGNEDDELPVIDATVHLYFDENGDGVNDLDDTLLAFASTNSDGVYLFSNLPPGNYVVKAEDQSIEAPPGSDNAGTVGFMLCTSEENVAVALAAGQNHLDVNYGFIEKAIIEGHVFHDENSSTLRDPWEPGLPNVPVRILGSDYKGNVVDLTTNSGPDGLYTLFVPPGSYTLAYDPADPNIPAGLIMATTPLAYSIEVVPGVELANFDFGRDHNGILGGRVFNDDNGNGTQNRGEDGIPDITIQLLAEDGLTLVTTTTTDHWGDYRFTGLPNGTFTIAVHHDSLPPGYSHTPTADPDAVKDGRSQPVVSGGTPNLAQVFGYRHASSTHQITGLIFDDNGAGGGVYSNGVRDGSEPGMAGVNLRVDIDFDKDGSVDEFRVITTEPGGVFITEGVPTGANVGLSILPKSLPRRAYAPTTDPNGPVDGKASFAALTESLTDLVFGYSLQPSTLTGTVVLGDGNGIADPGEPPLANVIIRATYAGEDDVIGTADDIVYTRFTNASGVYTVTNLDPGVFQITQSVPFGYKARADADGGNPANISLALNPGGHATQQDFENYQLPQIRGRVLVDTDRSGDFSVDDTPVQGVTVRIFQDVNGNGLLDPEDTQVATATTNALGIFSYGPISEPAHFIVRQEVPETMIAVSDADGASNGINHIAAYVEELDVNNRDFLNRPIPMTLGGAVFDDHNSNALRDGTETGLSGIVLALVDMGSNQQIATTTSAADGTYRFTGLWPGSYQVRFTPPSSHPASGGTPVALDNDQPGDNNGLQPGGPGSAINSPVIELAVNTEPVNDGDTDPNTNLTLDFGLWAGLTLGNLVWNDSNNDGLKGATESGISGITLGLYDPGADGVFGGSGANADTLVSSTTTNSSGAYSFKIYKQGKYYLRLTPPANRQLASTNAVNADNGVDNDSNAIQLGSAGNDIISPILTLTAGGEPGSTGNSNDENTIDFGLRACPTITVGPSTIAGAQVYTSYTQAFTASGGVAPRTFRIISGALPNGLSLSSGGVLSGTILDIPGNYWFRMEARDAQGCIGTRDYTLSVTCPNPVVTPTNASLPAAWHWQSYSQAFEATGVAAAYTYSRSSGSFPAGLTLNSSTGVLSGSVTGSPGIYTFTIRATDPLGYCVTDKAYTLEVKALWDFGDLKDTLAGTGYTAGDAVADHRTRLADDGPRHSIRPGFMLGTSIDHEDDAATDATASADGAEEDGLAMPATITAGSPVTAVISVTNSIGVTARANMWIDWNGNGSFEDVGERLVNNSTVTGSRSYTVTVPIGAVLNRPIGVRVRLSSLSLGSSIGAANDGEVEDYLLTVTCPTITTSPATLPAYYLAAPMYQMLSASGGTAPYSWSVSAGSLPPGLTLTTGGQLSGTPAAVGTYQFTVRAADAYGCFSTRDYVVQVKGMTAGNLVFNDQNDNGLRDAGEPGVPGVTVQAFHPGADLAIGGSGADADVLLATTTTNSTGNYRFDDLPVGPVYVRVSPPSNLRVTGGTPVLLDNSVDNDNNGSQPGGPGTPLFSPIITLTPGLESTNDGDNDPDTDLTIDFGIWSGVGIGSTLWADANSNGRIDSDENGIAGVRVELWRDVDGNVSNGAEVFIAHTTSNVAGHYTFLGYPAGRYQVVIPDSNFVTGGALASAPFASPVRAYNDDQVDDDSNAIQALGGGTEARSPLITLSAGDEPVGSGLGGVTGEFGRGGDLDDDFPDENADMTIDMGFSAPGSIGVGNLIFIDENDNGRADPGEGVEGVTVQLYYAGDDPETSPPLLSTVTDSQGLYIFSIVWEGTFFIHLPKHQFGDSGMLRATFPIQGVTAGDDDVGEKSLFTDEPWDTGVRSIDFTVAYGAAPTAATGETGFNSDSDDLLDADSDLTIDIGLYRPVGMGNLVFFDTNENGIADAGEGLDGVTVELYREDQLPGFDAPIITTITDNGGLYLFEMLKRGLYQAHIPASEFAPGGPLHGAVSISEGLAGDDDVGEDGIDVANPGLTGISSRIVALYPGIAPTNAGSETGTAFEMDDHLDAAIDLTIDFGFTNPVGLGNLVFIDYNGNGVYDPGEGAAGVRVELYRASQSIGVDPPIFAQTTGADGGYFFGSLSGGSYVVHIPASQFQAGGRLAGLIPLPFSEYGDDDVGQNGLAVDDPATEGISTNVVTVIADQAPTNDGVETGFNHTADDFDDDNYDLTIDIGFSAPRTDRSGVGNLVFIDVNGNGRYDSGEGAAGVLVQLFVAGADPLADQPEHTLTTDPNGLYLFSDLDEGDYFIHIPASQFAAGGALHGYFSLPGAGGDDGLDDNQDENGIDSPAPELTGISSAVFNLTLGTEPTTVSGETGEASYMDDLADANFDLTIDFGFSRSMGIGNLVFIDTNGNGRADAGEGAAGVAVQLFHAEDIPGWSQPLAVTTTDGFGRYGFSGLLPGAYIVHIPWTQFASGAPLAGLVSLAGTATGDDDTGEDGLDEVQPEWFGISTAPVVLIPGQAPVGSMESGLFGSDDDAFDAFVDLTIDFGFAPRMGVGNLVFADLNGNGKFDPDTEHGIDGVEIEIWNDNDPSAPVATTLTSDGGIYGFTVAPGTYFVRIPPGEFQTGAALAWHESSKNDYGNAPVMDGDDDVGEDGLDGGDPLTEGVRTPAFTLTPGQAPDTANGETGHLADSDDDDDTNSDLTIDFGFTRKPLGVGNLVFRDLNEDSRYTAGIDSVIPGVPLRLFRVGDNPNTATPVDVTISAIDGTYHLQTRDPGLYYIHIPASAFASGGVLHGANASPDFGEDDGTDDQLDQNAIQAANPASSGVFSIAFELAHGTEPVSGTQPPGNTEIGAFAHTDDDNDPNVDLTIDLGFVGGTAGNLVAVGNVVFIDANGNGFHDDGEGVDGVWMHLYPATGTPGQSAPLATTHTSDGGRYLFSHLPAGQYLVHVAADNFKPYSFNGGPNYVPGPLHGLLSNPGTGAGDDDIGEKGLDVSNPDQVGISSAPVTLTVGGAPLFTGIETGAYLEMNEVHGDANVDLTIDFGFSEPAAGAPDSLRASNTLSLPALLGDNGDADETASDNGDLAPETYAAWAALHDLGSLAAPLDDADGDGLSNLLEYALGLDPLSGINPRGALSLDVTAAGVSALYSRPATGHSDLRYEVQVSAQSAQGWQALNATPAVTVNADGSESLRYHALDSLPALSTGSGFVRLQVRLDSEGDGNPEATTHTQAAGWLRYPLTTGHQTLAMPLLKPAVYSGRALIAGSGSLTLTSLGSATLAEVIEPGRAYFLEVASGAATGHRFAIDSAASQGSQLVLDLASDTSTSASLPAALDGARVHIRPHWSLGELLPAGVFTAGTSQDTADRALFFDRASNQFHSRWLQAAGAPVWTADAGSTAPAHLAPGAALLLHHRGTATSMTHTGLVRDHDFRVKLAPGSQMLGGAYPQAQSPRHLQLDTTAGLTAGSSATTSDRLRLWLGDSQPGATGYRTYYLLQEAAPPGGRWVDQADTSLRDAGDDLLLPSGKGIFIQLLPSTPPTVIRFPAPAP